MYTVYTRSQASRSDGWPLVPHTLWAHLQFPMLFVTFVHFTAFVVFSNYYWSELITKDNDCRKLLRYYTNVTDGMNIITLSLNGVKACRV